MTLDLELLTSKAGRPYETQNHLVDRFGHGFNLSRPLYLS